MAAGLLAGIAILVRPGMLLFLPLVALWFLRRRQWSLALAFCVAAAVIVAPWTLRNARTYGRFVLVASEGGVTFWTGNHPLARGEGDLAANPEIKHAEIAFRAQHPGLTAEELEPLYYRDAVGHILEHPGWWLWLLAKKAFYTVRAVWPLVYATLHEVSAGVGDPLSAAGAGRPRRSRQAPAATPGGDPAAAPGPVGRHDITHLLSAGTVSHPGARSDGHRLCLRRSRGLEPPSAMNALVVVPTYNERDNLPLLVARRAGA